MLYNELKSKKPIVLELAITDTHLFEKLISSIRCSHSDLDTTTFLGALVVFTSFSLSRSRILLCNRIIPEGCGTQMEVCFSVLVNESREVFLLKN
jgi:hypothetical protein